MIDRAPPFGEIIERERGLQRTLTARRMTMIAIGGAIGTGLFLGSGFAIGLAGPGVLVSYAIGAVIALLLMACLAEMTIAHPTCGSFGAYAEYYVSPLAGFLVRYAYWSGAVLGVGAEVTAVGVYMHYWFPALPGWLSVLAFSALLIGVNARSVNVFGAIEYWFSAIKVTAIVVFIVSASYILWRASIAPDTTVSPLTSAAGGFRNYTAYGGFFPHGYWGVWVATLVAIFSYFSIEIIAVTAGEAAQPEIAVTRAFRATVFRLIVFYLLTMALVLAVVPWSAAGVDESPFVKVMRALHVPAAAGIFNGVILIAALSSMNSLLYVTSRMMFSLARAGDAPRRFGVLSRRGVPLGALGLSSLGIAVAAVLNLVAPKSAYIVMLSISLFGNLFTWWMIFVTHYRFRRIRARAGTVTAGFQAPGFPVTPVLGGALLAAAFVTTAFTDAFRMTLVFGLLFLAVLTAIYWLRGRSTSSGPPQSRLRLTRGAREEFNDTPLS